MRTVPLDEVCEITMGQAPAGDTYNTAEVGRPLIAGAGDFGDLVPEPTKFTTAANARLCEPGDIVLGIRASIGDHVLADDVYCLGRGVAGLRPRDKLNQRYLWHWLGRASDDLASRGRGATFKQVNRTDIATMEVPLPPIEEQRRIAAILDAADALRAKRRQAIATLDTLTQSIFIDMFGNCAPADVELGEVTEVQGGLQVTSKRRALPFVAPYLRVANVHRGRIDLTEIKSIRLTARELSRTALEEGDLLVVEGHGNADEIGRVARWNGSLNGCVHQNHLIRVRCDRTRLLPPFAEAFLNSWHGRRALLEAANTTSGLNTISTSDVRRARVPLPAIALQQRYVAAVEAVAARGHAAQFGSHRLENLFSSLQQRAFRGEL